MDADVDPDPICEDIGVDDVTVLVDGINNVAAAVIWMRRGCIARVGDNGADVGSGGVMDE